MKNFFANSKILFVVAHPDDEVLGCGGIISKLIDQGCEIKVIILGQGIMARTNTLSESQQTQLEKHQKCINDAKEILKYQHLEIHQLPDNQFDTVPRLEVIKIIENSKQNFQPDFVFTHHGGDLNIDHRISFEAVLTAFRPMKGETVQGIYTFETPSSTEWAFQSDASGFRPNFYMEISSDNLERKKKALSRYVYETRDFPHPRSNKTLEAMAIKRGSEVGYELAESLQCIRQKIT